LYSFGYLKVSNYLRIGSTQRLAHCLPFPVLLFFEISSRSLQINRGRIRLSNRHGRSKSLQKTQVAHEGKRRTLLDSTKNAGGFIQKHVEGAGDGIRTLWSVAMFPAKPLFSMLLWARCCSARSIARVMGSVVRSAWKLWLRRRLGFCRRARLSLGPSGQRWLVREEPSAQKTWPQ